MLDRFSVVILASLFALDIFLWHAVFTPGVSEPEFHFLDVGQGDSELVIMPGNIKVLTDAGPDAKVVKSLEEILDETDHYIDLAVISHPQLDHFNGFNALLSRFEFGAFITNGRDDEGVPEWDALKKTIAEKNIPLIVLRGGDRIQIGEGRIEFISPNKEFAQSGELNDTGLVELISLPSLRALFTADTGANIETQLIKSFDLAADILKIGHHGSKYSSSREFLAAVNPGIALIEAGDRNRYGHPNPDTLSRLASSTNAAVFRTDKNGTISLKVKDKKLHVFVEKN